jgi:hypothetical protein
MSNREVITEHDYQSPDGTVFFRAELEELARRHPDVECVPALIAINDRRLQVP